MPGLTLPSYLITVIQRIPRYILLLKDLIKKTNNEHPDYSNLVKAQEMMVRLKDSVRLRVLMERSLRYSNLYNMNSPQLKQVYTHKSFLNMHKREEKCLRFFFCSYAFCCEELTSPTSVPFYSPSLSSEDLYSQVFLNCLREKKKRFRYKFASTLLAVKELR